MYVVWLQPHSFVGLRFSVKNTPGMSASVGCQVVQFTYMQVGLGLCTCCVTFGLLGEGYERTSLGHESNAL